MPIDTTENRQQRAGLIQQARDLLDKADQEKRSLGAEERQQYDTIWADQQKLKTSIDDDERRNDVEREELAAAHRQEEEDRRQQAEGDGHEERKTRNPRASEEYRTHFRGYLLKGKSALRDEEFRALQSDDDVSGGFLIVPEAMASEIIKDLDNLMLVRQLAKQITIPEAKSLGIRRQTARMSTARYGTELQVADADTKLKWGKKVLTPHPMTGLIKVSREWLRLGVGGPEQIVRDEIAYDFAETQEEHFMTGTGDQQPLGMFVASDDGISTDRDFGASHNAATLIKADGLIEAKYQLKLGYRRKASWLFHRDAVKKVAMLKDGQGNYLWQPGIAQDDPDRILGLPVAESEYVPNTFSASKYVGMLADFQRGYYIGDSLDIEIQMLEELYAATNQVGFIARLKNDAMPVLEEAFARVKLGT